jgi:5'-3' exoribonuclease 1
MPFTAYSRVTMGQDSGGVPLSTKGVVIGFNAKSIDVVCDVPFMSGVTMGDRCGFHPLYFDVIDMQVYRCSEYRGSTVEFDSCLNLTNPQFVASINPKAPATSTPATPFKLWSGPYPAVRPAPGQIGASGFRPPPAKSAVSSFNFLSSPV